MQQETYNNLFIVWETYHLKQLHSVYHVAGREIPSDVRTCACVQSSLRVFFFVEEALLVYVLMKVANLQSVGATDWNWLSEGMTENSTARAPDNKRPSLAATVTVEISMTTEIQAARRL